MMLAYIIRAHYHGHGNLPWWTPLLIAGAVVVLISCLVFYFTRDKK